MPKNTGKGGKNFKKGAHSNQSRQRELIIADEDGQDYAQVLKMLGGSRVECMCTNGRKAIGVIRGSMRMKVWLCVGDVILISNREFESEGKVDVVHKYTADEMKTLVKDGRIPPDFRSGEERQESAGTGAGRIVFFNTATEDKPEEKDEKAKEEDEEDEEQEDGDDIEDI